MKMIPWTVSRSSMYLRRRLWDSSLSVAYRSEKRETSRAWREELVSWARVGDSPLTGLTERLRRGRGLGERLLISLKVRFTHHPNPNLWKYFLSVIFRAKHTCPAEQISPLWGKRPHLLGFWPASRGHPEHPTFSYMKKPGLEPLAI